VAVATELQRDHTAPRRGDGRWRWGSEREVGRGLEEDGQRVGSAGTLDLDPTAEIVT
jgi:hypothetical protein